jgi:Dolichyl-phosphate-mannose-protein mannosyltransferase
MKSVLIILSVLVAAFIIVAIPELTPRKITNLNEYLALSAFEYAKAVLLCVALASLVGLIAYRQGENGPFLLQLFVAALLVRVIVGVCIYIFNGEVFFGGDALAYEYWGWAQLKALGGEQFYKYQVATFVGSYEASGWGMLYMIAAIYAVVGRNLLAIQLVNSVIGAATVVIIFLCAHHIFNNVRVARLAAFAVAFFPSLVLWSSQALKDGPIVFLLALAILATLKLGEKLSITNVIVLLCALFALLSFRFYIFYMLSVAVGGSLLIGTRALTPTRLVRQMIIMIVLGVALTYMGVARLASLQFSRFGNLEQVQISRADAATRGDSGFGKDLDVSTPEGALLSIPIGLIYLLLAPFPWQLASLRQSITLPEMIVWWMCCPLLFLGFWFSLKYRLRQICPVLIFTVMLSVAYSIFQGNVGTAYRQRAQLLVFYFIFVAVGYVLMLEKREERQRQDAAMQTTAPRRKVPVVSHRSPLGSD